MKKYIWVLVGIIVVGGIYVLLQKNGFLNKTYTASRPAEQGCVWDKTYKDKDFGIEFLYQTCKTTPNYNPVLERKNDAIYVGFFGKAENLLVQRFAKAESVRIETAILDIVHKKIDEQYNPNVLDVEKFDNAYAKKHCIVRPLDKEKDFFSFLDSSKQGFVVGPDADYQKKIDKETPAGDIPAPACGEYGFTPNSLSYFEYHPNESKKTFIFVGGRQEDAFVDFQSFVFKK